MAYETSALTICPISFTLAENSNLSSSAPTINIKVIPASAPRMLESAGRIVMHVTVRLMKIANPPNLGIAFV